MIERTRSNRGVDYTRRASTLPRKSSLYVKHHDQKKSGILKPLSKPHLQLSQQHSAPPPTDPQHDHNHVNVVPVDHTAVTEPQYQTLPKSYRVSAEKNNSKEDDGGNQSFLHLFFREK